MLFRPWNTFLMFIRFVSKSLLKWIVSKCNTATHTAIHSSVDKANPYKHYSDTETTVALKFVRHKSYRADKWCLVRHDVIWFGKSVLTSQRILLLFSLGQWCALMIEAPGSPEISVHFYDDRYIHRHCYDNHKTSHTEIVSNNVYIPQPALSEIKLYCA